MAHLPTKPRSAPTLCLVYALTSARKEIPGEQAPKKGEQFMIKKLSAGLVAAVVCTALAFAGTAMARGADTGVTIHGPEGDFHGKVLSERAKCQEGRKVVVYKQKGRTQKPSVDQKIASDISERSGSVGVWSVGNTGFKKGKFYAKAAHSRGCNVGFSKTIKL
jgi:hypothetical protein